MYTMKVSFFRDIERVCKCNILNGILEDFYFLNQMRIYIFLPTKFEDNYFFNFFSLILVIEKH